MTKETKIAQIDTSPGSRAGSNFNQFTVQDLREFDNIKASVEIARLIEEQAMFQVGITQARLGNVQASETATGIQQSINNSYAQTESYFTRFGNYKRRVLQMNLDIAQFCAATDRDMTLSLIQDDMSRQFIKMNGIDLLNSQLGIRVFNSQELLRQNEMMKQLIMKNNTTNSSMSALAQAIYTESPSKLIEILRKMEDDIKAQTQAQRDHEAQMQQADLKAKQDAIDKQNAWQAEQNNLDRENKLRDSVIKVANFAQDVQDNNQIDVVGIAKNEIDQQRVQNEKVSRSQDFINKALDTASKKEIEKEKLAAAKEAQDREHTLAKQEMQHGKEIENQKLNQIEVQNKSQEKIAMEQHKRDLELMDKEMELKKLDIQAKKKEVANTDRTLKYDDLSAKDDLKTKKTLNRIKIKKAKNPPKPKK